MPWVGCCVIENVGTALSSVSVPVSVIGTAVSSFVVAGFGKAEAVGALFRRWHELVIAVVVDQHGATRIIDPAIVAELKVGQIGRGEPGFA